ILMTNPPFAGTIKEREILRLYKLAEKGGRFVNKIGRHILFLERSLQFIRPGGRMAIVLPQGIFNNTNAEYIRRFIMEEARILAVVGLHENTFKPHTGTKTSILFLQKYTDEEKEKIQQIKTKYESKFDKYFEKLKNTYNNCDWNTVIDEETLPEELRAFLESYFGEVEEIEEIEEVEEIENETTKSEGNETEKKTSLKELINEYKEIIDVLEEKKGEELKKVDNKWKKEMKALDKKAKKLHREISEQTLGGQIWLVLNDDKIKAEFKKFWLEGTVIKEMDYPIFMAVNKKPIKDNSGDYRYKKNSDGSFVLDEHGHLVIDHDLDEIAEAFIKFAKEQDFDFWRE
ncbi:MAG: N-6 DNA methylase, partial [Candidatus Aenigmatarchaeota archaeon]